MPEVQAVGDDARPGQRPPRQSVQDGTAPRGDRADHEREARRGGQVAQRPAPAVQVAGRLPPDGVTDDERGPRERGEGRRARGEGGRAGAPPQLDPQRREHPAGEHAHERRERLLDHVVPALLVDDAVPARRERDDRDEQRGLGPGPRAELQREQPDEREDEVERDLDAERPGDRDQLHDRVHRVVLPEHEEQRQLAGRRGDVVGSEDRVEREDAEDRDVVGRDDAGHAADRVGADVRARAAERRAHERAVEEVPREDEEADEPQVQREADLIQQRVGAPRRPVPVEPDVEHQHRQRGDAADPVDGGVAHRHGGADGSGIRGVSVGGV